MNSRQLYKDIKVAHERLQALYAEYDDALRRARMRPEVGKVIKLSDHARNATAPNNKER